VKAWSQLLRLDSSNAMETVVIPMPDGRKLVAPRSEVLKTMTTGYSSMLPLHPLENAAFLVGLLDATFIPRKNTKIPIDLRTLQTMPGLRGRMVNDLSELRPFTTGIAVKTAMDYCLSGGVTVSDIGLDIKTASCDEICEAIRNAIYTISETIVDNI
jgi:hypothetical protein